MIPYRLINRAASTTVLLFFSTLFVSVVCSAQGIVYSARYYYPPGINKTSHGHIYRIDQYGHNRIQLTTGSFDDEDPQWSPDGYWIAFLRDRNTKDSWASSLMVMDSHGHKLREIATKEWQSGYLWSKDSKTLTASITAFSKNPLTHKYEDNTGRTVTFSYDLTGKQLSKTVSKLYNSTSTSPSGRYIYNANDTSTSGTLTDTSLKNSFTTPVAYTALHWLSDTEFLGIASIDDPNGAPTVYLVDKVNVNGSVFHYGRFKETGSLGGTSQDVAYGSDFIQIDPWPGKPGVYLAWENWHNSTVGTDYGLYCLKPEKKIMEFIAESQFAPWSPDHRFICTSPGRQLSTYQQKKDKTWSYVFTSPLQIVDMSTADITTIQSGLINVTGADWR